MRNNRKGFTLIELLVVIAIIGLLSTLAVVSLNNARQKARDSRRASDIKQIQSALEMYFNEKNEYPFAAVNSVLGAAAGFSMLSSGHWTAQGGATAPVYMGNVPANPIPAATAGGDYIYNAFESDDSTCTVVGETCAWYSIHFHLEQSIPSLGTGTTCNATATSTFCS